MVRRSSRGGQGFGGPAGLWPACRAANGRWANKTNIPEMARCKKPILASKPRTGAAPKGTAGQAAAGGMPLARAAQSGYKIRTACGNPPARSDDAKGKA